MSSDLGINYIFQSDFRELDLDSLISLKILSALLYIKESFSIKGSMRVTSEENLISKYLEYFDFKVSGIQTATAAFGISVGGSQYIPIDDKIYNTKSNGIYHHLLFGIAN